MVEGMSVLCNYSNIPYTYRDLLHDFPLNYQLLEWRKSSFIGKESIEYAKNPEAYGGEYDPEKESFLDLLEEGLMEDIVNWTESEEILLSHPCCDIEVPRGITLLGEKGEQICIDPANNVIRYMLYALSFETGISGTWFYVGVGEMT
jgi:hypothetical protein